VRLLMQNRTDSNILGYTGVFDSSIDGLCSTYEGLECRMSALALTSKHAAASAGERAVALTSELGLLRRQHGPRDAQARL
jgi:hypothetical protein